jgi:hypothetical protein
MNAFLASNASRVPSAILLAAIAGIILYRGRHRQFPFFLAYTCSLAFIEIALTAGFPFIRRDLWFNLNWAAQVVYTVMGILAMHESFRKVLRPYFAGRWWFPILVPGVVLGIFSLCVWKALHQLPGQSSRLSLVYLTFYLASDYMRAAIFGMFAVLVIFWRARWQPCAYGVMKGFGLYTIVGMLADLLRSDFGTKMDWVFIHAPPVAYLLACLIWLGAFLQREPENGSGKTGSLTNVDEVLELLTRLKKALE